MDALPLDWPRAGQHKEMDDLRARLRRFVRSRVRTPDDIDDVIQEAHLRVLRYSSRHLVESEERLLFTAAKNLAVDSRRRHSARERVATNYAVLQQSIDSWPSADEVVYATERLQIAERAVAQLPARCREAFLLNRIDGLSYSEVARRLGISTSAVEKLMARACLYIDAIVNSDESNT